MSDRVYAKPVVINSTVHTNLKIAPVSSFAFAKELNSCVVLGSEFLEAAKYYPIIFSQTNDNIIPVVILGIKHNLYVDDDGKWQKNTYMPAFIRRYPFILAEGLSSDGSLAVCIDSNYKGFEAEEGERLFTDAGENTPMLSNAINFLRMYNTNWETTKAFIGFLKGLNIFKTVDVNITLPGDVKFNIKGISMIDEEAMLKLPDADLLALVKRGYLAWIYAHLVSITNFTKMFK